ncbi:hypothetical protein D4L85_10200 [Chryseolinea soli]|uniref:Uncharacterized protein n=1 Tax=Chryseolinea soli TaxID=2321403 RepID=A0A385SKC8_9BACT|nr:hypothetical protein D4L85_10200 [Chryseolinea soli]
MVDWTSGILYKLNGEQQRSQYSIGGSFDGVRQSSDGVYAVVFDRHGTKGLVLKHGKIIREINRSYYCAQAYEYPIEIIKLPEGYAIVHCPEEYNLIEIELIESGKKVTQTEGRKPADCFHTRLQVNPSNTHMLNAGWVWHPYGILELYDLKHAIADNSLFDNLSVKIPISGEVGSAAFLGDDHFVVGTTYEGPLDDEAPDENELGPNQIGLFSISANRFVKVCSVDRTIGTLVPMSADYVLDLYQHPKVIDINSGAVLESVTDIDSGKQDLAITHRSDMIPPMAISLAERRIAIGAGNAIEILEWPA